MNIDETGVYNIKKGKPSLSKNGTFNDDISNSYDVKKKSKLKRNIIVISLVSIFLILIITVLVLLSMIFDSSKVSYKVDVIKKGDLSIFQKVFGDGFSDLFNLKNEAKNVKLNENEVNGLIRNIDNGVLAFDLLSVKNFSKSQDNAKVLYKDYNVEYKDGQFHVKMAVDTENTWLFGGIILVDCMMKPLKNKDGIILNVSKLKLGSLNLGAMWMDIAEDIAIEEIYANSDISPIVGAIESFEIDNENNVKIVYYIKELRNVFLRSIR